MRDVALLSVRGALLIALVVLAGCLDAGLSQCADGRLCPPGTVCDDPTGECLLVEQRATCNGEPDGKACSYPSTPDGLCREGVCRARGCGDGVVSSTEDCDGENLDGATCLTLEYTEPAGLKCDADCRFDPIDCIGYCGDGIKNGGEPCDGDDIGTSTCQDLGYYDAAGLACSIVACTFDVLGCTGFCQDGILQGSEGEICDMAPPPGQTCLEYGFDRGILGCSEFCSPGFDDCDFLGWQSEVISTTQLTNLWGADASNVYATANSGIVVHFDGTDWTDIQLPTDKKLLAIHGAGGELFAVGSDGVIVKGVGGNWVEMDSGTTETLNGVWARASDDVYAVGGNGTIRHYDGNVGNTWSSIPSDTTNFLFAVWGDATTTIAVGGLGTITRSTGGAWSATILPSGTKYLGIFGVAADDVWAVGLDGVAHYDGAWTEQPIDGQASSVWSDGNGTWFAVGQFGAMWFLDGGHWVPMAPVLADELRGIWGSSADDVFVGSTFHALRYDGRGALGVVADLGADNIYGLWGGAPDELLAVALDGNLYEFDGTTWTATATGYSLLFRVWAAGLSDVFVSTIVDGMIHWNGAMWTKMTLPISVVIRDMWGTSGTDVFAVGPDGVILRYNGTWSEMSSGTTEYLWRIWGTSATDVWAVGDAGTLLHYDGADWTGQTLGTEPLLGIWGASSTDVYAVGSGSLIWHYDGISWQSFDSGLPGGFARVEGTASDDVFFTGRDGMLLHFDGVTYDPLRIGTNVRTVELFVAESQVIVTDERGDVHTLLRTSPW